MQDFTGIDEKLNRACENIYDFDREIALFFQEGDYPILPKENNELLLKAIQYHKNRSIPPRFGVLAGEIIHHLRACFDHVVWHFSAGATDEDTWISFPVCKERPSNSAERRAFERKIERVNNSRARSLIERFQPYMASEPLDDPLFIIHKFDIVDKHRNLVICTGTPAVFIPHEIGGVLEAYERAHPEASSFEVAHQFESYGEMRPYVSFRNFGKRELQPVIPGLTDLFNYTIKAVDLFANI